MARLLVVEDDPDLRFVFRKYLVHRGYEVTVAAEAGEALTHLRPDGSGKSRFDLVLLDIRLPDRSGLELLETLRQGVAPPPVIVVTALWETEVCDRALAQGATDYLVKPVDFIQLQRRIDLVLGDAEPSPFSWAPIRRVANAGMGGH